MIRKDQIPSYEIVETYQLGDIHSTGYLIRHKKTGAKISLIENDDENKVFYIGFRTPPEDSTGVAHIVEHSVLCGSEKFPLKDPFVELVKGSLNTFLNAMTYPDKTVYPVASCNDKDFQNLMDVYLDAVFHPNIYKKKEIFWQEGWHYELESLDDDITLNGVVYNEMKGAFSSPEGVVDREIFNSLFPDTSYGFESGGDPDCIPELTAEGFLDFHARFYHPSNSYIYLYGNMNMEEKLNWLDQTYLSAFDQIQPDSDLIIQEAFHEIHEVHKTYPISEEDSLEENTFLSYNMVIGTALDRQLYQAFEILDYALLSAPGAPLKQALLDAGIGKDIMGSYDNGSLQPMFSIVAKNADKKDQERFKQTILDVLKEQAEGGLSKKSLRAGLNSMEFKYREADFGTYPKGLIYGLSMLDSWLYDERQPFMHLQEIEVFDYLREQIETDYFETLIRTYMLENTHVSMVIVEPEKGLNVKNEEKLKKKLLEYKKELSEEQLTELVERTHALKRYQEEPSTKEELEMLPVLAREDMETKAQDFINSVKIEDGTTVLHQNLFSNGIHYLNLMFDIRFIDQEDLPYLGILKAVLGYMDTAGYSYQDLTNEINLETGGINSSVQVYPNARKAGSFEAKFEIHAKSLYVKLPKTMSLITEILTKTDFSDEKRLKEILAELKSRLQMGLSSSGHTFSAIRALSYFSETTMFSEKTSGIDFYEFVCSYAENFEEKKAELTAALRRIVNTIFTQKGLVFSVTADEEGYAPIPEELKHFKSVLPVGQEEKSASIISCEKKNEGYMDSSKVQYVSRAGNFLREGFSYTGALKVLKVILSYDYLWNNIRVKGGAYGCGGTFLRNGNAYFSSYRDPNLGKTNEIYDQIPEYLRSFHADERDMTKYIIGTVSDLDTPLNPSLKGLRSASAYISGLTLEDVQRERDEILSATEHEIQALADLVEAVLKQEYLCVIGNEEKLKQEASLFQQLKRLSK